MKRSSQRFEEPAKPENKAQTETTTNSALSPSELEGKLAALRAEIDELDRRLIHTLSKRRDLARRITSLKIDSGSDLWVADRVREIVETRVAWAEKENLDPDFIAEFFRNLIDCNMKFEEEMLDERRKK